MCCSPDSNKHVFLSLLYKSLLWKPLIKSVASSHDTFPIFLFFGPTLRILPWISSFRIFVQAVSSFRNSVPSSIFLADFLSFTSHLECSSWPPLNPKPSPNFQMSGSFLFRPQFQYHQWKPWSLKEISNITLTCPPNHPVNS